MGNDPQPLPLRFGVSQFPAKRITKKKVEERDPYLRWESLTCELAWFDFAQSRSRRSVGM